MRITIIALFLGALIAPLTAEAQTALEGRVDRLEREMRAVQRKVFPGGAGRIVEPQITAPDSGLRLPGTPANSAVADLNARVNALESQIIAMTGQVEQTQYRIRQLQDAFEAYKQATDAKLQALETRGVPAGEGAAPPPVRSTLGGEGGPVEADAEEEAQGAVPFEVAGVERPNTGDEGEDEYVYGYRLWAAKHYDAAQRQLESVVERFPEHWRASYARNLLGRAYYDEGEYRAAADEFLESYRQVPGGARAPESLYWLAKSLAKLKAQPSAICKVYDTLETEYPGRLPGPMQAEADQGRAAAGCE